MRFESRPTLERILLSAGLTSALRKKIGVFIPTGAVHLLGAANYANLLRDNNSYQQSIVTIPVGDLQHATLDIPFSLDPATDIDQTTLQDVLEEMPWCQSVERTKTQNKILIQTTQTHLATARQWIDNTLPTLYLQHIDDKLDVTTLRHLIPRRLDKPTLTAASTAYADKLKVRPTITATAQLQAPKYAKPPNNARNQRVGMTFAETAAKQSTPAKSPTQNTPKDSQTTNQQSAPTNNTPATPVYDYKAELNRLTIEIEQNLTKHFETIFAQMESKIDSWIKQQNDCFIEQEQTNDIFTKQLQFIVDNMKKITNYATPAVRNNTPSPRGEGKS